MLQRRFASVLAGLALVALIAGCAGPSAGLSRSGLAASGSELAGTWRGQFWLLGGSYWTDDGTCLLQIKEDGTFTATMTPTAGANNLAKPESWSGTVVQRGRLVFFRTSQEPWSYLARSGDTLYGVVDDHATQTDIAIDLARAGRGA